MLDSFGRGLMNGGNEIEENNSGFSDTVTYSTVGVCFTSLNCIKYYLKHEYRSVLSDINTTTKEN
jgi:hypothetical protein